MDIEKVELYKISAGYYKGSDGAHYRIKRTDRAYTKRKAPSYYMLRFATGLKPQYISGLFQTEQAGVFTLDIKDEHGIKQYYKLNLATDSTKIERSVAVNTLNKWV